MEAISDTDNPGTTPGVRAVGLLPLAFAMYLTVALAARVDRLVPVWKDFGIRELPTLTQAVYDFVSDGGCYLLGGVIVIAAVFFWRKPGRKIASLAWFNMLVLLLITLSYIMCNYALQQPAEEMMRALSGQSGG